MAAKRTIPLEWLVFALAALAVGIRLFFNINFLPQPVNYFLAFMAFIVLVGSIHMAWKSYCRGREKKIR